MTITATAKDGSGIEVSQSVWVYPAATGVTIQDETGTAVKSITIDIADDATMDLHAIVGPENAYQGVKWTSSSAKVVTVDPETGEITGLKTGKATITAAATDGSGKKATCTVNVVKLVKGIEISGGSGVATGKKLTLKANVTPRDASNRSVVWASSDKSIATVSTSGVVTAAKRIAEPTQVTITATAKDGTEIVASHTVWVHPAATSVAIFDEAGEAVKTITMDISGEDVTEQLRAVVGPENAYQGVKWTSSSAKVVTVDAETGEITGLKTGKATITAAATDGSGKKATCTVIVVKQVKGIEISGGNGVATGKKLTLKANVTPTDASNRSVVWASSDKSIATVSTSGVVTAAKGITEPTQVTITATSKDGTEIVASHTVWVHPAATSVAIFDEAGEAVKTITMDISGEDVTKQLSAVVGPENAYQGVKWTSSSAKVVTVDPETGEITGLKTGKVTITAAATDGSGKKATCTVNVVKQVKGIEISGGSGVATGKKVTLKANVTPTDASNRSVVWTSSDKSIATVSTSGVVTAAKGITEPKQVTITATAKDGSGIAASHVVWVHPTATGVTIQDETGTAVKAFTIYLSDGDGSEQLHAVIGPENAYQNVIWSSSSAKVATVDSTTGMVVALKKGTATITAKATDGSGMKATVKITVK